MPPPRCRHSAAPNRRGSGAHPLLGTLPRAAGRGRRRCVPDASARGQSSIRAAGSASELARGRSAPPWQPAARARPGTARSPARDQRPDQSAQSQPPTRRHARAIGGTGTDRLIRSDSWIRRCRPDPIQIDRYAPLAAENVISGTAQIGGIARTVSGNGGCRPSPIGSGVHGMQGRPSRTRKSPGSARRGQPR